MYIQLYTSVILGKEITNYTNVQLYGHIQCMYTVLADPNTFLWLCYLFTDYLHLNCGVPLHWLWRLILALRAVQCFLCLFLASSA